MDELTSKYIKMRNKPAPLTVFELRHKLNSLPPEFDDLEVCYGEDMAQVLFIRKETDKDTGKSYLMLNSCSSDNNDIFD